MKTVVIPFKHQRLATGLSLEMVYWCKDQGLQRDTDFEWRFVPSKKEIQFYFYGDKESYATMFALRWAGNEV